MTAEWGRLDSHLEEHDSEGEDVGGGRRVRLEQISAEVARVAVLLIPRGERDRLAQVSNLEDAVAGDEDVVCEGRGAGVWGEEGGGERD